MTIEGPTNECCRQESNRVVTRTEPRLEVQQCKVCKRNHYTAIMDPVIPRSPKTPRS